MGAFARDRHIFQRAFNRPAQPQARPAELGQFDARVLGVQSKLLRIWKTQAWLLATALEAREAWRLTGFHTGKEALVGLIEPPQHLLLRVNGAF